MSDEGVEDENAVFGRSNILPRSPFGVRPKTEPKKENTTGDNNQTPTTSAENKPENPYANVTERKRGILPKITEENQGDTEQTENDDNESTKSNQADDTFSSISFDKQSQDEENNKEQTAFFVEVSYKVHHGKKIVKSLSTVIPLKNPNTDIPDLDKIFRTTLGELAEDIETPYRDIHLRNPELWSLSQPTEMAIPIKDITDLIKEYKGESKDLNTYVRNIDHLWKHIENYEAADKARFMMFMKLKLVDKAAEAVKDTDFAEWDTVKQALKKNINPQKNIEKAELKLTTAKQKEKEDVEAFSKRIEELLENFNKSFNLEEDNEILKTENDRKARRAFENGLTNDDLKNKAIAKGAKTLKEAVDYIVEQELRQAELKPKEKLNKIFCNYCKSDEHEIQDCKKRKETNERRSDSYYQRSNEFPRNYSRNSEYFRTNNFPRNNDFQRNDYIRNDNYRRDGEYARNNNYPRVEYTRNNNNYVRDNVPNTAINKTNYQNKEVTCYACNQKGHYANECKNKTTPRPNININNEQPSTSTEKQPTNEKTFLQTPPKQNFQPKNMRIYENEIPIEEAIVCAEETDNLN